ncbi:MAG: bifunctional riboflavin kinase/FAD synthetase [Formosa sp.]|nr:bifunctional riboflavin kinase/FAD synthetase [Formosa sp.]MDC0382179.1 bifunctional riboflavin kinase/FAD synthetase [Flavobacteriaceae bacterium]MDC0462910.1 bifunctional riboflavin kinase/FAD synthetase [Flavobacteriaceae bacterium]MDC3198606.1 bifunctional riboflavin kinase/FAD synthetase [Flavobacteriaceae bacterium]
MKIKSAADYDQIKESIVTIGTFDGVHLGHQKIINKLIGIANEERLQALVLTFFPHPRTIVQEDASIKLINTIDEKAGLMKSYGVDHLVVKEFTKEFSRLTALEYVRDVLVNKLHVKHIIVGYDHHFGRNRTANINDLKEYGAFYGFKVTEIDAHEVGDVAVSSTKIRAALTKGDIITANHFLGYNFMLTGLVVKGQGLGKTIQFPTANLKIEESYKLIPKKGVYLVQSVIDAQLVYGMMNIGTNPTVSDADKISVEVFFFDFDQSIYGQVLIIQLLDRIRDEIKFPKIEDLKLQLESDSQKAINRIKLLTK